MMHFFLSRSRLQKQGIALLTDMIFLPLIFVMAVWMRFEGFHAHIFRPFLPVIIALPFIAIPIFIRLGLYRAVIRFVDQKIIWVVVYGVTLTVLALLALIVYGKVGILSRAVFGIFWMSAVMYVLASRFLMRAYLLQLQHNHRAIRVAIYGAGHAGIQMANVFRFSSNYQLLFFIDDKKELQGTTIAGLTVYASHELDKLMAKYHIQEVHVIMPSVSKKIQQSILNRLEKYRVKVRVTPPILDWLHHTFSLQDVRDIEIEDLLGRDLVAPHDNLLKACIAQKVVMVTGAGGSIGSELCRQILLQVPKQLIVLDMSEFALYAIEKELTMLKVTHAINTPIIPFLVSVQDFEKCRQILTTFQVDTIYHAAAYKHVPVVEHHPIEGIRNNVFGTWHIAQAAILAGVSHFVLISTDKAVRPTNVMGATKRLAELILQALAEESSHTCFCMVRFGNVLGSSGSVVPLFREQIKAGGPITITHPDMTRYFMTIGEAAQLVIQAGSMSTGGDVFVLDMGEPVKILDLAKRMVHLSGLTLTSETQAQDEKTIAIEYVGLRPGEKLYEELLIGNEVSGTEHPLIMRAQEKRLTWDELEKTLKNLHRACERFDHPTVRALLLDTIQEYQPQCYIEDSIWLKQADTI